jgi:hypothetical protein
MKHNLYKFVAIAGVLLGGSLAASAAEHIVVNVPFSFVLAGLEFQPGQYSVDESSNGILTVSGGGHGALVLTTPAEMAKAGAATALRFANDGREYHLIGVQVEGEVGRAVSAPALQERKLSIASR